MTDKRLTGWIRGVPQYEGDLADQLNKAGVLNDDDWSVDGFHVVEWLRSPAGIAALAEDETIRRGIEEALKPPRFRDPTTELPGAYHCTGCRRWEEDRFGEAEFIGCCTCCRLPNGEEIPA